MTSRSATVGVTALATTTSTCSIGWSPRSAGGAQLMDAAYGSGLATTSVGATAAMFTPTGEPLRETASAGVVNASDNAVHAAAAAAWLQRWRRIPSLVGTNG